MADYMAILVHPKSIFAMQIAIDKNNMAVSCSPKIFLKQYYAHLPEKLPILRQK